MLVAIWETKGIGFPPPIGKGVISTAAKIGGPAKLPVGARAWALIVVP